MLLSKSVFFLHNFTFFLQLREVFPKCTIPKIVAYRTLMKYVNSIDVGEVQNLHELSRDFSVQQVCGVYWPLKPFLLRLADLYITVNDENPCLTWFNGQKNVIHVSIGADGAPFGKDDNATGSYTCRLQRKVLGMEHLQSGNFLDLSYYSIFCDHFIILWPV